MVWKRNMGQDVTIYQHKKIQPEKQSYVTSGKVLGWGALNEMAHTEHTQGPLAGADRDLKGHNHICFVLINNINTWNGPGGATMAGRVRSGSGIPSPRTQGP